jgi:hypothetical protein
VSKVLLFSVNSHPTFHSLTLPAGMEPPGSHKRPRGSSTLEIVVVDVLLGKDEGRAEQNLVDSYQLHLA